MSARLVYVMGPSGAGKDSLLGWLRQHLPPTSPLHWAQRTISRPLQQSHAPGTEQYESVCPATFATLRSEQAAVLERLVGRFKLAGAAHQSSYAPSPALLTRS